MFFLFVFFNLYNSMTIGGIPALEGIQQEFPLRRAWSGPWLLEEEDADRCPLVMFPSSIPSPLTQTKWAKVREAICVHKIVNYVNKDYTYKQQYFIQKLVYTLSVVNATPLLKRFGFL